MEPICLPMPFVTNMPTVHRGGLRYGAFGPRLVPSRTEPQIPLGRVRLATPYACVDRTDALMRLGHSPLEGSGGTLMRSSGERRRFEGGPHAREHLGVDLLGGM